MKIYAYTWDDNFQKTVELLLEDHPEYKDYVEFVNLGVGGQSEEWLTGVDTALENGDKYPSLIPADIGVAKYWSEDDTKTANLYDLGFTDEMFANNYDFVLQYSKYNDELKAVTYQANPGSLFYRRDIAKEVFGTDDPEAIQEKLGDWDSFFKAAEELKAAGYKIVSGPNDIEYPTWDGKENAWVSVADDGSETLALESSVSDYLERAKTIYDNDYSNNSPMWDGSWMSDMKDDSKVFCYFGCPWFVGTMVNDGGATEGNWGACVGPKAYHWGGTFVSIGKDTPNPELAAWIAYELCCDDDFAVKLVNSDCDTNCSANKVANERLINGELSDDFAASKFLGGQNPFEVWAEAAEGLDLSKETYSDGTLQGYMNDASTGYNEGTYSSLDDALKYIKDQANTGLGLSE
ncbi:MAG: carbohydrate ABC transporter substrate-binding protein [Eubacterium sp.]|nr:carbohydrate ABC transporter substrate-binding protein [Eubacterium sp.]